MFDVKRPIDEGNNACLGWYWTCVPELELWKAPKRACCVDCPAGIEKMVPVGVTMLELEIMPILLVDPKFERRGNWIEKQY